MAAFRPRSSFFVVMFLVNGNWEWSGCFEKIANARKMAKKLGTTSFAQEVKIFKGGPGGELVS